MTCIRYTEGYKYRLEERYTVRVPFKPAEPVITRWLSLSVEGDLTFEPGYAWDGASGPTIDTKSSRRPSLVHDGLYQLIRLGFLSPELRKEIDKLFEDLCIEDGMWRIRARVWFRAVRLFAGFAVDPSTEPKILCAPCGECQ